MSFISFRTFDYPHGHIICSSWFILLLLNCALERIKIAIEMFAIIKCQMCIEKKNAHPESELSILIISHFYFAEN